MKVHVASSKRIGFTPDDWRALKAGDYTRFSAKEQAALRFAEKLTRDADSVAMVDIEHLKQHFSDEQIIDLDVLVGLIKLTTQAGNGEPQRHRDTEPSQ